MFCYFMLGCGFLAGWNAFLTATDFFNAVRSKMRYITMCNVAVLVDWCSRHYGIPFAS
jgi:hypothetical protein